MKVSRQSLIQLASSVTDLPLSPNSSWSHSPLCCWAAIGAGAYSCWEEHCHLWSTALKGSVFTHQKVVTDTIILLATISLYMIDMCLFDWIILHLVHGCMHTWTIVVFIVEAAHGTHLLWIYYPQCLFPPVILLLLQQYYLHLLQHHLHRHVIQKGIVVPLTDMPHLSHIKGEEVLQPWTQLHDCNDCKIRTIGSCSIAI